MSSMNNHNRERIRHLFDYIYDACRYDSKGELRTDLERNQEYARYIGWLEGNLMECLTDEQVELLTQRVNLGVYSHAVDETVLHDDKDGSFY